MTAAETTPDTSSSDTGPASKPGSVVTVGDNLTLADVWTSLHASAEVWRNVPHDAAQQERIDDSDLSMLRNLSRVPAALWQKLCEALGWTVYGSVGLSRCEGAEIGMVCAAWEASATVLTPDPVACRPAWLLNPALVPESRKLSDLMMAGEDSNLQICLFIAARSEPIEINLPEDTLQGAAPQLADFLRADLRRRNQPDAEDAALVSMFSGIIDTGEQAYC